MVKDAEPSAPLDEHALMRRFQGGEVGAFEQLYDRLAPRIMGFLYGMSSDRALAEDLTQETFLRAWRAAPRWQPRAQVSTWLFQIAKRLWWKERARRVRRPVRPAPPGPRSEPESSRRLEEGDEARRLRLAISRLPPRSRVVFVLVRLGDLPYAETARILGLPLGTVKSRMAFAEAWLRKHLETR